MLKRKKGLAILLSVACLSITSISAYAMAAERFTVPPSSMKASANFTEISAEESTMFALTNDDGSMEYSNDSGKTWTKSDPYIGMPPIDWKPVTVEDLQKQIQETKANLVDPHFMKNWTEFMGKTEQDLLTLISDLEQQIKEVQSGVKIESATIENEYGIIDVMISPNSNEIAVSSLYSVDYIDRETGETRYYQAEAPEELRSIIEKAYKSGEITKENRDKMIAEIK